MDRIKVEKIGGFAGFGGPGSKLRSCGEVALADLSTSDRTAIERLFTAPDPHSGHPDAFRYRITRDTSSGAQTIEVSESHVPESVKTCVTDRLE